MPLLEPDPSDPLSMHGVARPDDAGLRQEMAAGLVDEFARDGMGRDAILRLFQDPRYGLTHGLWLAEGEATICRLVNEAVERWRGVVVRTEVCTPRGSGLRVVDNAE